MKRGFITGWMCAGTFVAGLLPAIADNESADSRKGRKEVRLPSFTIPAADAGLRPQPKSEETAPVIADFESAEDPEPKLETAQREPAEKEQAPVVRATPVGSATDLKSKVPRKQAEPVAMVRKLKSETIEPVAEKAPEPYVRVAEAPLTLDEIRRRLAEEEKAAGPSTEAEPTESVRRKGFWFFGNRKESKSISGGGG